MPLGPVQMLVVGALIGLGTARVETNGGHLAAEE